MGSNQALKSQLREYKKKYYTNRLIKGTLLFLAFFLTLFIIANTLEFTARFGGNGRSIILYGFILLTLVAFIWFIGKNIIALKNANKQLSNEEASRQIGAYFPEISDKLLNIIQLENLSSNQNDLLLASIEQKSNDVGRFNFASAIEYKNNKKYLKYALGQRHNCNPAALHSSISDRKLNTYN